MKHLALATFAFCISALLVSCHQTMDAEGGPPYDSPPYLEVQWSSSVAAVTYRLHPNTRYHWLDRNLCWIEPGKDKVCISGGLIRVEMVR